MKIEQMKTEQKIALPSTHEIRAQFLKYFVSKGHKEVPSSPVIPHDDPSLLFTNAGMNQFKDLFLGRARRDYARAASSQKCVRVGGKHNDLENVGHTARHLTFFEMLGNFSFGDYFKAAAIQFAWEVSTEIFRFDPARIFPTVFTTDDEAFELWTKYVPAERITRLGEKDNFWAMGETGPCGPCSELYFDRGSKYGDASSPLYDTKGERYLEFWNLVFMQYDRDASGTLLPLPKPSIDTGAGLERVMSLIMNTETVFETDILRGIIAAVENLSGKKYDPENSTAPAFRVIADHLRSLAFAIADGASPSNTDRGYVLRKIIRRAVRYGKMIGLERPFLGSLFPTVTALMGSQYGELELSQSRAQEIVLVEEENFLRTLKRGGSLLQDVLEGAKKDTQHAISGDDAFRLKDTYGLPLEEIELIAHDAGLAVDTARYAELEQEAKMRSKMAHKKVNVRASTSLYEDILEAAGPSLFVRDAAHAPVRCDVAALLQDGVEVDSIASGTSGELICRQTPFYAEMGGQVGDTGLFIAPGVSLRVENTYSPFKGIICHKVHVQEGTVRVGDSLEGRIDSERRSFIERNHTATHLVHKALFDVLGGHVRQSGSYVDESRIRFDFAHHKAVSAEEIAAIELAVNTHIQNNYAVLEYEMLYEEAQKRADISQFFGDKYGSVVRVVEMGPSKELCGGTHTSRTGNIGMFRVLKESSIASGVRRLEAITGADALLHMQAKESEVEKAALMLKTPVGKIVERIESLLQEKERVEKALAEVRRLQLAQSLSSLSVSSSKTNPHVQIVSGELPGSAADLKEACADLVKRYGPDASIILGCREEGRAHLFLKMASSLASRISAADLIKAAAALLEGNGGGKRESAQGSGKRADLLHQAIDQIISAIE